jgi:hypothetical protein
MTIPKIEKSNRSMQFVQFSLTITDVYSNLLQALRIKDTLKESDIEANLTWGPMAFNLTQMLHMMGAFFSSENAFRNLELYLDSISESIENIERINSDKKEDDDSKLSQRESENLSTFRKDISKCKLDMQDVHHQEYANLITAAKEAIFSLSKSSVTTSSTVDDLIEQFLYSEPEANETATQDPKSKVNSKLSRLTVIQSSSELEALRKWADQINDEKAKEKIESIRGKIESSDLQSRQEFYAICIELQKSYAKSRTQTTKTGLLDSLAAHLDIKSLLSSIDKVWLEADTMTLSLVEELQMKGMGLEQKLSIIRKAASQEAMLSKMHEFLETENIAFPDHIEADIAGVDYNANKPATAANFGK